MRAVLKGVHASRLKGRSCQPGSMMMCLSNQQDDDRMMMCMSNSQHDSIHAELKK